MNQLKLQTDQYTTSKLLLDKITSPVGDAYLLAQYLYKSVELFANPEYRQKVIDDLTSLKNYYEPLKGREDYIEHHRVVEYALDMLTHREHVLAINMLEKFINKTDPYSVLDFLKREVALYNNAHIAMESKYDDELSVKDNTEMFIETLTEDFAGWMIYHHSTLPSWMSFEFLCYLANTYFKQYYDFDLKVDELNQYLGVSIKHKESLDKEEFLVKKSC